MSEPVDSADREGLARLKFDLLAVGARISERGEELMDDSKAPLRTRSGVSGGLDISLGHEVDVNVPVRESFCVRSPYLIDADGDDLVLVKSDTFVQSIEAMPTPNYYGEVLREGQPMYKVAQMCSRDRICFGITGPACRFWHRDARCQYCSIGKNADSDASRKEINDLMDVLEVAMQDPVSRPRHILVGGGTPNSPDMGAELAAEVTTAVKARFDLPVYVMIAAPLMNDSISRLYDSGVDDLGMNLEFWSASAWQRYIPGKEKLIGKRRYLDALSYAQSLFGPIRTRSILIAGLEPASSTLEAVSALCEMGVLPILSPFRPLDGTVLEDTNGLSGGEYFDLWREAERIALASGALLGPDCVPCQNNTLALPR